MNVTEQKIVIKALRPFIDAGLLSKEAWRELQGKITDGSGRPARPDLITRAEAAKLLQVTSRSVINWQHEGKLQAVRLAGKRLIRYRMDQVSSLLKSADN